MKFTVEVPLYLTVEVDAADADSAAAGAEALARHIVDDPFFPDATAIEYDGVIATSWGLELLNPDEDRDPDVYVCRGGKLTFISPSGLFYPTGDACGP